MLHNIDDLTISKKIKCDNCGAFVEDWIDMVPLFSICIPCAQMTMRRLFEDLIQHHNPGKRVSLLQIMYHGEEKREPKPTRSLFDFGEC